MRREFYDPPYPRGVNPYPSAPQRLAVVTFALSYPGRILTKGYSAMYAARKSLDFIIELIGEPIKQVNHATGLIKGGITIRSGQLDDILEYEYHKEEESWSLSDTEVRGLRQFLGMGRSVSSNTLPAPKSLEELTGGDKKTPVVSPRRGASPGLVSILAISERAGVDPRQARNALRKSNYPKPAHGWSFTPEEVDKVVTLIKEFIK